MPPGKFKFNRLLQPVEILYQISLLSGKIDKLPDIFGCAVLVPDPHTDFFSDAAWSDGNCF